MNTQPVGDPIPLQDPAPTPYSQPVDTTGWDTDSYGIPGYTATNFGDPISGWDPTKWNDPTHQTPKYVWGRIAEEARASGDPNWQQTAIDRFMQAYPGTTYGGRDVIQTPWGEEVDIFRDFGGENGTSWQVNDPNGGGGSFDLSQFLRGPSYAGTAAAAPSGGGVSNEFADPRFQSVIEQLGPAHPQWAEYQAWKAGQGAASGSVSGGSVSGPQAPQGGMQSLYDVIGKMLNMSGDYNQGILDRRVESARESMNRARSSQSDTLRAQLAERGLLGSGAETTAISGLEEDLGDIFAGQARDIYADESARADDRLLRTMSIASGLSQQDADRLVDWFNAQTNRSVGEGQVAATNRRTDADAAAAARDADIRERLGLGDLGLRRDLGFGELDLNRDEAMNAYNLGVGNLGLGYDRLAFDQSSNNDENLIRIIQTLFPNTDPSKGYR
jgi:hypothetical protein